MTFIIVCLIVLFVKRIQSVNVLYRLRRHNVADTKVQEKEPLARRIYQFIKKLARPFSAWEFSRNLDFKLRQAGIPLYGAEFVIVSIVGAIIATIVAYIITMNLSLIHI